MKQKGFPIFSEGYHYQLEGHRCEGQVQAESYWYSYQYVDGVCSVMVLCK